MEPKQFKAEKTDTDSGKPKTTAVQYCILGNAGMQEWSLFLFYCRYYITEHT